MQLKKGILLLALAAGTSVFVACKKDKESNENPTCWECTMTTSYTPSMGMDATVTTEVCQQTESQIRELEKQSSATTTVTMQGVSLTMKTNMKCAAK